MEPRPETGAEAILRLIKADAPTEAAVEYTRRRVANERSDEGEHSYVRRLRRPGSRGGRPPGTGGYRNRLLFLILTGCTAMRGETSFVQSDSRST